MKDSSTALPDMDHIRRNIPIRDVAQALNIRIASRHRNAGHCWRTENHNHGDRNPSLSFHRNRVRCHVCDPAPLSTLDLVRLCRGVSLLEAARWIAERFPGVPTRGEKKAASGTPVPFPFGLIHRGYWSKLNDAERAVLPVLIAFAKDDLVKISYRRLAQESGKVSDRTIRQVLRRFQKHGWLLQYSNPKKRETGYYRLRFDDGRFQKLMARLEPRHHREIEQERHRHSDKRRIVSRKPVSSERAGDARLSESISNSTSNPTNPNPPTPPLPKSNTLFTTVKKQRADYFTTVKKQENEEEWGSAHFECQAHGKGCVDERGYPKCWDGVIQ